MTSQARTALEAVAVTIGLMLCASLSYAQSSITAPPYSQTAMGQAELANQAANNNSFYTFGTPTYSADGAMYVACWAQVPLHNTAYFSDTFSAPSVYSARKEFRELVTARYGDVSKLQCAAKFSEAVVKDIVQQWKDKARTTNGTIVETDWSASTAVVPSTLPRSNCFSFAQLANCWTRIPERSPP